MNLSSIADRSLRGRQRRRRGAPAGAAQFAEDSDANAYASSGKPRTKSEREAYAAI